MGTFSVLMRVCDLSKVSFAEVEALADTDSIHSYIPRNVWENVGADPTETRSFACTDKGIVEL